MEKINNTNLLPFIMTPAMECGDFQAHGFLIIGPTDSWLGYENTPESNYRKYPLWPSVFNRVYRRASFLRIPFTLID